MNQPRPQLTPERIHLFREQLKSIIASWGMEIPDSALEEHVKFFQICYGFLGHHSEFEKFIQNKGYILRNKIRIGHEQQEYSRKEVKEKIVTGEFLIGGIFNEVNNIEYTVIVTKAGSEKVRNRIKNLFGLGRLLNPQPQA